VPKKASERRQKALDDAKDLLQMKEDVLMLKEEVKGLRKFLADNKLMGIDKVGDASRAGGKSASKEATEKKL
jgi:isopentenyl diphosphate isomerase/L-lactate dehydrogenase-like FMN-dependent dehydrogenase